MKCIDYSSKDLPKLARDLMEVISVLEMKVMDKDDEVTKLISKAFDEMCKCIGLLEVKNVDQ